MSHNYHDALPGYDPEQIWHDGCVECEQRGEQPLWLQLGYLDPTTFARAWQRAQERPHNVSSAESPLLRDLAAVQAAINISAVALLSAGVRDD